MEERVEIMVYVTPAPGGRGRGRHRAKGPGALSRLLSFLAGPFRRDAGSVHAIACAVAGNVVLVGLMVLAVGLGRV